jgi:rSAM/selenodomain-associated transferase 1
MIKNQEACILLFVKYPEKGKVKLRLSVDINEDIVQELYRCFVQDTLTTVRKIDSQLFICFFPVEAQKKFQKWLGSTLLFLPQNGANLGERMKNSFTAVFTKGFRRAILIGSDSPDLPNRYIEQAFTILQTRDIVLGPTADGGYYLIGFNTNTFTPNVFEDIPWSNQTVFQETMMKIKQAHRSLGLLPIWSDIDTIADLKHLIQRAENTSFKSSQTMTYLRKNHIRLENNNEAKTKR